MLSKCTLYSEKFGHLWTCWGSTFNFKKFIDHYRKYVCAPQVKNMRKEIADLLRTTKQENARIRVETVIRENLLLQAFEVLELFLELLAVRAQLVEKSKDMPPDMIEALSSLVYSAQRLQVASDV